MSDVDGDRDTRPRKEDEVVSGRGLLDSLTEGQFLSVSPGVNGAKHPSLQELIEAELTARLAPLQPDSLEDPPDSLDPISQHYDSLDGESPTQGTIDQCLDAQMTLIKGALDPLNSLNSNSVDHLILNGRHTKTTSLLTCDSLEAQHFSLDSLADSESGVDVASPQKLPSAGDASPSPPMSLGASSDLPNSPDHMSNSPINLIHDSFPVPYNHFFDHEQHLNNGINGFTSSSGDPNGMSHFDYAPSVTPPPDMVSSDVSASTGSLLVSAYHVTNEDDRSASQCDDDDDDDELPELPEGDDTLPELPENDRDDQTDVPDLPEADQKVDLPEADQDDAMDVGVTNGQVNGDANGEVNNATEKKKKRPDGERKGKKKRKKFDLEKKKAAYTRDEIYEKKIGPRVRSFDTKQMKSKFEKPKTPSQISTDCKFCGKQVFQMEKIIAEKASWHKNCFRCSECNKALTLDTYSSHEGIMYCKPHFRNLFQPKAVIQDPEEAHRERMARRPKMIIVESKPEALPDDVVRATSKPDYGLDDLQVMDVKSRFSMFESFKDKDGEKPKLEPANVRRSSTLMNKAAKFQEKEDEHGIKNSELGEFDEEAEEEEDEEEDEEYEEGEEEEEAESEYDENGDKIEKPKIPKTKLKKKQRPMSFSGVGDLQNAFEKKTRREKMSQQRKEELSKFRQMLCAGKNISLKEKFESGHFEGEEGGHKNRESVKFEGRPAAMSLKARFEKGEGFTQDEDGNNVYAGEKQEVDEIFKDAETANRARNLFKQIDSELTDGPRMRGKTNGVSNNDRRRSSEGWDYQAEEENNAEESEDPQINVDCPNTQNILQMFRKMELQGDDDGNNVPRPMKEFTPPPEGESFDDDSDDEYTDDDEDSEDGDESESEEGEKIPKYKDEFLEMTAKKAANLRAKFERWETEVERQNEINKPTKEGEEEAMPSLDTARNLRAMFENKAKEDALPLKKAQAKVNRFV